MPVIEGLMTFLLLLFWLIILAVPVGLIFLIVLTLTG